MRPEEHSWHHGGPPWRGTRPHFDTKRRFLFLRFARILAAVVLLFLTGMGLLAYVLTRLFGGGSQATLMTWVAGCGVALVFPLAAAFTIFRSARGMFNPLARVMAAADAVADGDLSVRVPEEGPGEFSRLAQSFNRMVAGLEHSDKLRRSLMADVAHELRTPLHIIQGNLEGIQDGVYEPTPEHIELLLDETRQLARLVEDLRTLSLAEAGQLSLHKEPVDVSELCEDVATSFSAMAEAGGVSLTVETGTAPLSIQADAGRLDQVLSNLVANALRHTPRGGTITLRAAATPAGMRLQVSDNGSGIPPEDVPYIFERFWSGGAPGGSGLGLAIARQLVQAHGGHITVESQTGKGATFTIVLPNPPEQDAEKKP
jgi:signal transduction histidine kinase